MNMKKIIGLLVLSLIPTIGMAEALGFGMIINQDYGDVTRGSTQSKELATWVMDSDYYPYTEDPYTYDVLVEITSDYNPYVTHQDSIISQVNRWSRTPITLTIPKKAKYGYYETQICAVAMSAVSTGIGINVGVCQRIKYNIVPKGKVNRKKK